MGGSSGFTTGRCSIAAGTIGFPCVSSGEKVPTILTANKMEKVMAEGSGKAREISLEDDFGDVAVNVNGVRVEVHTDGSVLAYTNSGVDAYTNGPVRVHPARLPKSYGGQAAN